MKIQKIQFVDLCTKRAAKAFECFLSFFTNERINNRKNCKFDVVVMPTTWRLDGLRIIPANKNRRVVYEYAREEEEQEEEPPLPSLPRETLSGPGRSKFSKSS